MLYTQLIEFLPEYYLCIEDKETFKRQLCEYLSEEYQDYGIEDLDQIVEYENWDNVKFDEDPIIEKTSKKNILIKDCQDCFICFRQSEIDIKNIKSIITMENVIRETPSLCQVPHKLLQKEFDGYLAENYADLIEPNIWYYQEEVLQNIANEIYTSCQYALFINTLDEKIDEILSSMVVGDIDKNEISSYFKLIYTRDSLPSNEDFELCVRELVNKHVAFNQIYEKFVALFNTDYIQIEWNDEKLGLFQKYDEEGWVDSQNLAEYEAYKYIIPLYKQHFLCKNSTRYRPVIEQLPVFFSYASNVLDILFKHKILIHNDNVVVYNHDGNVELACKEIMALPE